MGDIVDVYEMTAMQAGMLFQSLYAPKSGSYVQQYWARVEGPLDTDLFRDAWANTVDRHEILRSSCHWEELDHPAFAIHAKALPEWHMEDWGADLSDDFEDRLQSWMSADRERGFSMSDVPLMRFALFRLHETCHVFVWSFHHLLLDGWSGALLVEDVLREYRGEAGTRSPLPFRTYVEWLQSVDRFAAESYWRACLLGIEGPTQLGIARAETGTSGVVDRRFWLSQDLTTRLAAVARHARLTLASLMQGAWGIILGSYSSSNDVLFGSVLSGRPPEFPGAEDLIGLCLNTVPARLKWETDKPLVDWLHEIQAEQRASEAHGYVALSDIQAWSGLPSSTPLFDSLLIVETYPETILEAVSKSGSKIILSDTGLFERTSFPLVIKVVPGEEIEICLSAETARVPAEVLHALERHFISVLSRFAMGLNGTVGEIGVIGDAERDAICRFEQGPNPDVEGTTLDWLLARLVEGPDTLALVAPDGAEFSHRALMARSHQIALQLTSAGVAHGDVVAVCQDRTSDMVASLIAVWRCGGAYLPLDPSYPAQRISFVLQDSQAKIALVDELGMGAFLQDPSILALRVDTGDFTEPTVGTGVLDSLYPTDIAYVLYTSGSTGRPKGVPIPHVALANFLASMSREPGLDRNTRLLAVTTIAFDIAGLELFGPLVSGGCVLLAPTGAAMDGKKVGRLIEQHDVNVMQATPAAWRVLRDSGWSGNPNLKALCGGEALDSSLASELLGLCMGLWNLYGPTETTIWSAAQRVESHNLWGPKAVVGGPLDNTSLTLRDTFGRRVPFGIPGELWIGGLGLSPGYLGRDDLTVERFVDAEGARFYRTGDQMRRLTDGTLEFLGRFDDQVKLRGFRIELGEIEQQLERAPGVSQAVAIVRGEGNDARLIAYLRMLDNLKPDVSALRAYLAEHLPGYMIPQAYVAVETYPLTPNGKIDRKALPDPTASGGFGQKSENVEVDLKTGVVAGIWAQALGQQSVGTDDDFFALGGHSLTALRIVTEVRRLLNIDVELRELFDFPRFGAFCDRLEALDGHRTLPPVVAALHPVLSAAQHRQWLLSRLDPISSRYNLFLNLRITGPLNVDRVANAVSELSGRHDVLRSRYPSVRGVASVEVVPDAEPFLQQDDLGDLDHGEAAVALKRIEESEAETPFDLATAPPWRVRIVRISQNKHALLITLHHILADEWSFRVMVRDLTESYGGQAESAELPAQYSDFAHWQESLDLDDQRGYWVRQLANAPAFLALPTSIQPKSQRQPDAGRAQLRLGAAETDALERLAQENGATLFMCLLAAYAVFLSRHSGDNDILIGIPVSNRRLPEFQETIGLFVNTLPVRANLDGTASFADVLSVVRETLLSAQANQDVPFEQIVDLVAPPRSDQHGPIVQTMFSMPRVSRSGQIAPGIDWKAVPRHARHARFDLSVELERGPDGLAGHIEFAKDIFEAAAVDQIARRFETLLMRLPGAVEAPLEEVALLTYDDLAVARPSVGFAAKNVADDFGKLRATVPGLTPSGPIRVSDQSATELIFDERLFDHLKVVSRQFGSVALNEQDRLEGGVLGLAERAINYFAEREPEASQVSGEAEATPLKLGWLGDDQADILSLPEFPAAFLRAGEGFRPCNGVRAVIVDQEGTLKPPGMRGVLAVAGAGLARGYAGAPAVTALSFVPDPNADPSELDPAELCLLLTKKYARQEADGRFLLCAEPEPVVRLNGPIVQLESIEATYAALEGVKAAAIAYPARSVTAEPLQIFLEPDGSEHVPTLDCLRSVAERLPPEARPSKHHIVASIPRNMDGMPDRVALHRQLGSDAKALPRGSVEITLATIWAGVLDVSDIGRDESFFDLGGDSIRAIQVVARAAESGLSFEPGDIFRHQSIARLAEVVKTVEIEPLPSLPEMDDIDLDELSEMVSFGDD